MIKYYSNGKWKDGENEQAPNLWSLGDSYLTGRRTDTPEDTVPQIDPNSLPDLINVPVKDIKRFERKST